MRGNVDRDAWALALPHSKVIEREGRAIYVRHILDEIDVNPSFERLRADIYGHSHKPSVEYRDGVAYLNPGAAARGGSACRSASRMSVVDGRLTARIVELDVP